MTARTLTFEDFDSRVGQSLRMCLDDGGSTDLVLLECARRELAGGPPSFELLFLGGSDAPRAQGSYLLSAEDFEPALVFLVPVRQIADGVEYHAAFNHYDGG
jgi:hypothetical protein